MFRRQPLLRFIERRRLALGIGECLHRTDRVALIQIGGRVLQRLNPIARETVAFFSVPFLVAAITPRPGFSSAATDPPLALVVLTISCRLAGMRSHRPARSAAVMSGPNQVELVVRPIERSVPDQHKHEIILRLRIVGDRGERLRKLRLRRLVPVRV